MTTPARPLVARVLRGTDLLALDAVLALLLAVVCGYAATEAPLAAGVGVREPAWLSWLVGVLLAAPVAVRRTWPVPAAVATFVGMVGTLVSGVIPDYASGAPVATLACVLYLVGVAEPARRSMVTLGVCLVGTAGSVAVAATDVRTDLGGIGFNCLVVAGAWSIGRVVRERRAYALQVTEQLTHRAVADERLRIARELHDIVAHSMSLIAVKAAVANHVADASPDQARDALGVIEETSRGALQEMRRALGVLRDEASYGPMPGLNDLPALAEQAAAGGVDVHLEVGGEADLPPAVGLSVFRIVQESLTNVVKHAAPARCRVTVRVHPREARVEVTDDGRRDAAANAAGHGLIGMRERVAMYGGDFAAGPRPQGGFTVTARLPYGSIA